MRHTWLSLCKDPVQGLRHLPLKGAHTALKAFLALSRQVAPRLESWPGASERQGLAPEFALLHALTRREESAPPKPKVMRRQSGFMAKVAGLGFQAPTAPTEVRELSLEVERQSLRARFYRHPQADAPLLLFFHGGGFVFGDVDTHDAPCRALLSSAGVHVLSVEYRLAPEAPYPAAFEDAWAAYQWMLAHAESVLGLSVSRWLVGGDSAGGNLAAGVAQAAAKAGLRLDAQLLIYPAIDRDTPYPSLERLARGFILTKQALGYFTHHYTSKAQAPTDFRLNPGLGELPANLAPAYLVTAGFDPLCDEGAAYAQRLKGAQLTCVHQHEPALIHGFINMVGVSQLAREASERVGAGLKALLEA